MSLLRALTAHFKDQKFDLIHTHKYKDNILGTIAALLMGVPRVIRTVHGLLEPFTGIQALRMGMYEFCDDIAIRVKADRIIAVSSQIERELSLKFNAEQVVQIHNGVSIEKVQKAKEREETRGKLGLEKNRFIIGTVGRLTRVKGHEYFLRSAKQLLEDRKDLHFMVIGDGPLLDGLKSIAKELDILDNVAFLGHRDDTYDLMRAMDIFVLPSLHEGIPMVILEALALERPVIASRIGGIPEVITDGVEGILVPAANSHEITKACQTLMNNPVLAESYGHTGRLRVEQEFSSTNMAMKVCALYKDLLGIK